MAFAIALSDEQWELVADLFDPPGRRGAPALIPRRQMVDAMLFIGRTGIQWRYLPERYGAWTAIWAQWRRWRANGVWAAAMTRLVAVVRWFHEREPVPSMVMVDAQTVKGGRYGPTFHEAGGRGGRTIGTKRTLLVEILGLPVAAAACSARPHDAVAARELLRDRVETLPRLRAIVGDRAYRGLERLAVRKRLALDIKAPPPVRPASSRSGRSTGSSTRSPSWAGGAACRAATRAARQARGRGSRSPRSATSHGARSPETAPAGRPRRRFVQPPGALAACPAMPSPTASGHPPTQRVAHSHASTASLKQEPEFGHRPLGRTESLTLDSGTQIH